MARQTTAKDKLLVYINIYQKFIDGSVSEGGCPILNTAIDTDDTHPALREKVLKAVLNWKNRIVKVVEAGISSNEINAAHNPEQIALTIIAMVEGGIMISRLTTKTAHWDLIMDSLKKYINNLG
jgi:hypothetical protein